MKINSNAEHTEHIELLGILEVKVFDKKKLIDHWIDKNLIVNLGKTAIMHLIAGESQTDYEITNIGFGTGISDPTLADTTLTNLYSKALITPATHPTNFSTKWNWTLGTTEYNGYSITEYGLFMNNTELFSRKIRGTVEKTVNITLEGSWTITIL